MSSEIPDLPPRKAPDVDTIINESKTLLGYPCYSPLALLVSLEASHSDHQHVFKSLFAANEQPTAVADAQENILVDTVDTGEPVIVPTNVQSRFICQLCHVSLLVNHTSNSLGCSGDSENLCHHFHLQKNNEYRCCECQYTLSTEIREPILPMALFSRLEATRAKARSFADLMQKKEETPTLVSTYSTVLIYISDLLKGIKRNINTQNPNFIARVGLGDGSLAMLEAIGYQFVDNYLITPEIEAGSPSRDRLKAIQQEIIIALDAIRQEQGVTSVPISLGEGNTRVKTADMQKLLGIVPSLETRYTTNDDYINQAYALFGLTSGANDQLVQWAYKKITSEPTALIDAYDALDNLVTIANHTHSVLLQTLIAYERSQGKIGRKDIGDAYAYFGVTAQAADDRLLIGLYQVKMSDEPLEKNTHYDKLKTIAIARHSTELIHFLKQERGIPSSTHVQSVEDMMGVPAHMINSQQNVPVGLNNIGNTCYFNSLLQYYFTFIPFRETMINNQLYVEGENSELKKIGGIEVDQSEIRRAKKFVNLLKDLFIQLQTTDEKAISPEYDLAYMALLNEKDEDDITKKEDVADASKEQQPETDTNYTTADVDKHLSVNRIDTDMTETPILTPIEKTPDISSDNYQTEDKSAISIEPTDEGIRPDSPPPAYHEISNVNRISFTDEKSKPEASIKAKERPSVDSMMFGKQQDVTECMGNVMYLVEAALKPLQKTQDGEQVDDMIRQVFYGKARQILSYCDNTTLKTVKKEMEEDFSHVIVDASEGKDLYDGLDEYFFADQVENFQGGHEATREVTVKSFPPILQILVQRVQFDRATANVYKSNAYIQFDKIIYLDRYAENNFEELKHRRSQVAAWRADLEKCKKQVRKYTKSDYCRMPVPDLLEATRQVLENFMIDYSQEERKKYESAVQLLEKEAQEKKRIIEEGIQQMQNLKEKIQHQYDDYTKLAYKLHAVFIHQGQANYGHYWIYILDHKEDQWWKYNDSLVTKVHESEIYHDTTGSTANPYFLVYVDASKIDDCVETIVTRSRDSNNGLAVTATDPA